MWKQLEDIQDYLDCDFLCLFSKGPEPKNCQVNLPSERVRGIPVASTKTAYVLKNAVQLRNSLNRLLENHSYQNLILFEPFPVNLYLAQVGRQRHMNIIPWFSGDYSRSNLIDIKTFQNLPHLGKAMGRWLLHSFIVKYLTQVSSVVITDSPHLFLNKQRVVFVPSQTINQKEMAALPCAPVGEKKEFSLLFVGRVVPLKGLHYLIQALSELKDPPPFHLTIVGPVYGMEHGGYEFTLRRLIQEKGLGPQVTLTGNISDRRELEKYFLQADFFILPSLTEGAPKAICEAMAYGLPVVASRVGGIPLLVRDGRDGLLIDSGNPADLASALGRMLGDRQMLRLMGQSARERSQELAKELIFQRLAKEINAMS
jgi:glycosyltransferase involved in cell wall biosynthesis